MNIFTVWSPPTATQRRSGPPCTHSERELRAECATWKSLKTTGKRCVSSVHPRCTGAVTILCCAPVIAWGAPETCKILSITDWKTDQKARDVHSGVDGTSIMMLIVAAHFHVHQKAGSVDKNAHCTHTNHSFNHCRCFVLSDPLP